MTPDQDNPRLKIPPWSEEAEQRVIGAVMLDESVWDNVSWLPANTFFRPQHRLVWMAFRVLAKTNRPIDITTTREMLIEQQVADKVQAAYLAELCESTPAISNAATYADIVFEKFEFRRRIELANQISQAAYEGDRQALVDAVDLAGEPLASRYETPVTILTGQELWKMGAPIPWIWPGWLPEAMLTLLAGEKGKGKSTLAMAVAACVTTGKTPWSDLSREPLKVLYWSGEDDVRIMVGKAQAAGVDFELFSVVGPVKEGRLDRPFEPSIDMPMLLDQIRKDPPTVLIIDPIIRILKGKNSAAEDVRNSLDPLAAEAERLNIAILGIGHFTKGSGDRPILDRFLGSQAWTARARMVWSIVDAGDSTLFGKASTNVASERGVMEVSLSEHTVTFDSGKQGVFTRTEFGEVNTEETIDELERRLVRDAEADEKEARKSERYEREVENARKWLNVNGGYCTSGAWETFCKDKKWSVNSGGKGVTVRKLLNLQMARRGLQPDQITFWHLPDVDVPE